MPRLNSLVVLSNDFFVETFPSKDKTAPFFHTTMIPTSLGAFFDVGGSFFGQWVHVWDDCCWRKDQLDLIGGFGWMWLGTTRPQPDSLFGDLVAAHARHVGLELILFVFRNFSS